MIYKLASRYLSSKNSDEAPVRQVCISHSLPDGSDANKYAESKLLLTRSKDLAQKLNLYTKRLINTRLGIIAGDRHGEDDRGFAKELEEDTTRDLLSLNDEDFPIVCTFNHFLRLLENLVRYLATIPLVYLSVCPLDSSRNMPLLKMNIFLFELRKQPNPGRIKSFGKLEYFLANSCAQNLRHTQGKAKGSPEKGLQTGQLYHLQPRVLATSSYCSDMPDSSGFGLYRYYGCHKGFGVLGFKS